MVVAPAVPASSFHRPRLRLLHEGKAWMPACAGMTWGSASVGQIIRIWNQRHRLRTAWLCHTLRRCARAAGDGWQGGVQPVQQRGDLGGGFGRLMK
jgi:hypothetical protein